MFDRTRIRTRARARDIYRSRSISIYIYIYVDRFVYVAQKLTITAYIRMHGLITSTSYIVLAVHVCTYIYTHTILIACMRKSFIYIYTRIKTKENVVQNSNSKIKVNILQKKYFFKTRTCEQCYCDCMMIMISMVLFYMWLLLVTAWSTNEREQR